jgi:hypothetical protein
MPSLGAILALRDKKQELTIQSILDLPHNQFNIVKQLSNAFERTLAKQILEAYNQRDVSSTTVDS